MMKDYPEIFEPQGLDDLMERDESAREYYNSLPEYVKEMVSSRADNMQTIDDLRRYADNILAGDK